MSERFEILLVGGDESRGRVLAERLHGVPRRGVTITVSPDFSAADRAQNDARYDLVVVLSPGPETDPRLKRLLEFNRPIGSGPIYCWWPESIDSICPADEARITRLLLGADDRRKLGPIAGDLESRYHNAFDHAAVGMALISTQGRLLEVNRTLTRLLGYRPDQLIGRTAADLTHPEDIDPGVESFSDIATRRFSRYEAEKRYLHQDGRPIWVHLDVSAVLSEERLPLYFIAQVSDISRRKRSELEADRNKRLVDAIQRIQAQYIRKRDARLLHREIGRQLAELTGSAAYFCAEVLPVPTEPDAEARQAPDLVVHSVSGVFGRTNEGGVNGGFPSRPDALVTHLRMLLLKQPQAFEGFEQTGSLSLPESCGPIERLALFPLRHEGSILALIGIAQADAPYEQELLERIAPVLASSASVLGSLRQSQHRERAERELVESQRTLLNLMHNLPGVVYRCENDAERTLTFASAGCEELTGHTPEVLLDGGVLGFGDLIHPEDRRRVEERVRWALIQRESFELEYRITAKDGTVKWIREQGAGVLDERGETLYVEGFLSDVTAKHKAEEQRLRLEARVQQSHKLESLGVLAGGIAHDFNNLLMGILGHAGLAGRHLDPQHPVFNSLAEIESAALRAARLTDHMLAFTGRGPLRPRPLDLSESVFESAPVLEKLLPARARFELDLANELPAIESDPRQLQQVLVQLVRNAAESIGDGEGVVRIATALIAPDAELLEQTVIGPSPERGAFVALTIGDNGSGMTEDVQERAFDPFFTTKGFGRGLGLSTVLGIVRSHGGHVQLRSSPITGTSVRLLLPLDQGVPEPRPEPPTAEPVHELMPAPPPPPRPITPEKSELVLVVDDEQIVRGVATAMLEEAGYRVIIARDGQEGLEVFTQHAEDVHAVLLDMSMPRLDGEAALVEMRKVRPDVRILLTSGFSEQDAMHRIARRRGVGFIQKPYRAAELLEHLAEVLRA